MAGLVSFLSALISPPHLDLPHSCHFRFRVYMEKKRGRYGGHAPSGGMHSPASCYSFHLPTSHTSEPQPCSGPFTSVWLQLSHGALTSGPEVFLCSITSLLFSVPHWRWLLAHFCLFSSQRRLWIPWGLWADILQSP